MNKIISVICEGGQNFTIVVPELSADKVAKQIRNDVHTERQGDDGFFDMNAYVPSTKDNPGLFPVKSKVIAVLVISESHVQGKKPTIYLPNTGGQRRGSLPQA
ncbi:hypothetical protein LCGC14_0939460 [marine sediment metagenome]|uniref:Uncharacterized protein n=1 Tax=marine sediment metagenome TaxID=412755 RepID=A0A0F9P6M4_9ZZZZ